MTISTQEIEHYVSVWVCLASLRSPFYKARDMGMTLHVRGNGRRLSVPFPPVQRKEYRP